MEKVINNNFEFKPAFNFGYEIFKKEWLKFLKIGLVYFAIMIPFYIIDFVWRKSVYIVQMNEFGFEQEYWNAGLYDGAGYIIFSTIFFILSIIIGYNLFRIGFKIYDGEKFELSEVYKIPGKEIINYILGYILYIGLIILGAILFIIPGIYFAIKYIYVINLIVDKGMGVKEAFNKSALMTNGVKLKILGFHITQFFIFIGIIILGLLALIIGVFPALFFSIILLTFSTLFVYRKLYQDNF